MKASQRLAAAFSLLFAVGGGVLGVARGGTSVSPQAPTYARFPSPGGRAIFRMPARDQGHDVIVFDVGETPPAQVFMAYKDVLARAGQRITETDVFNTETLTAFVDSTSYSGIFTIFREDGRTIVALALSSFDGAEILIEGVDAQIRLSPLPEGTS